MSLKLTASGEREITMTRSFSAPSALVFDALTKPELVKRWMLGNMGASMPVCEIDLRIGGAYRFVWRYPSGSEMTMTGEYRDIARPERLVNTQRFDMAWMPGDSLLTTTLIEEGGKTTFTCITLYDSRETRDKALKHSGNEAIARYDRLEILLAAG